MTHFKKEIWIPTLLDRRNLGDWEEGGRKTMGDRIKGKVREILETHRPLPFEEKMVKELKAMIAKADEHYK